MQLRIESPRWVEGGAKCPQDADADNADFNIPFDEPELQKGICRGTWDNRPCRMRNKCLVFALINNEQYGVWGGLTEDERKWVRKEIPKSEWTEPDEWLDQVPEIDSEPSGMEDNVPWGD